MRILLVDDHLDSLQVTAHLLTMQGYDVKTATTAMEAEEKCSKGTFDVVIADLMLPDRDGYSLAVVARRCGIPAIALSALAQVSDIAKSKGAGFIAHLTKPVELAELERVLRSTTATCAPGADAPLPDGVLS